MCDQTYFELCRLCLNSGGVLVNIFDENNTLGIMMEKTIEDLIDVKVVEDTNYPWLVCSTCMEKLTEFRLFKRRCAECLFVFYNRIQKRFNPATKCLMTNREEEENDVPSHDNKGVDRTGEELVDGTSGKLWAYSSPVEDHSVQKAAVQMEDTHSAGIPVNWMACNNNCGVEIQFPGGIKKEFDDDITASEAIDRRAADVQDQMIFVKEEVDAASGCSAAVEIYTGSGAMWQGDSHCSNNEDSGKLERLEDKDLCLPFNVDVEIKEECDVDINQDGGGLGGDVSQVQVGGLGQDGSGVDGVKNFLHACQICNEGFAQKESLSAHMMHVHPVKGKQLGCDVSSEAFQCKSGLDAEAITYKCEHCSREFSLKFNLKKHIFLDNDARPHKCEVCSMTFKCKQELKRHKLLHLVETSHKCEVCSKSFHHKHHLNRHMLTHTGERRHKCDVCEKAFTLKQHLKDHMVIHSGEKPHKCEVCPKAFMHKKQLNEHMFNHNGARPHVCEECSKAFTCKQNLERHTLIHTGKWPLKCEICSKGFHYIKHLEGHMLIHTGERPHKCETCPKTFKHKHNLEDHMLIHRDTTHLCGICSRTFKYKSGLTRHMKVHKGNS
ncbi:uncharacterized protein [Hetaerina americana]|uniref:uncharacterized protein n=1 Tax=Hetaerina americana TaxID=62018 RepID=UPI003A7F418B